MELLLVLIVAVFIMAMVEKSKNKEEAKPKPVVEKNCPPHRWEYNENNKMFCVLCKQYPGFHVSENGNYNGK